MNYGPFDVELAIFFGNWTDLGFKDGFASATFTPTV